MSAQMEMHNVEIEAGTTIKVKGKISDEAKSFVLNLGSDVDNLALHFNPRFNDQTDGAVIVCNSKADSHWGCEQRDSNFPFSQGSDFKFYVTFSVDKFEIKLPNGHVVEFPNQTALDRLTYLSTSGDIKLVSLKFD